MQANIILPAIAVVAVTALVAWRYNETVSNAYTTFDYFRRIFWTALVVLVAWTFLKSGSPYLFALALGLIAFATIWFMVERPDKELV